MEKFPLYTDGSLWEFEGAKMKELIDLQKLINKGYKCKWCGEAGHEFIDCHGYKNLKKLANKHLTTKK